MLSLLREAINVWGLPSRVRAGDGKENVMIHYRGESHGSFITGPRVHNTRIEKLWHEVVHCILYIFKNILLHLEHIGVLNRINNVDIFSLHYVYMPRINSALSTPLWICSIIVDFPQSMGFPHISCGFLAFCNITHPVTLV